MINKINMKDKKTAIIIGIVLLSILAGLLVYRDTKKNDTKSADERNATSTEDILSNLGVNMTGDGKVEVVSMEEKKLPKAPSLNRSTEYKNTLAPEIKTAVLSQMNKTIEALKANNADFNSWIMLGVHRKTIGDYEGAKEAWDYAKLLAPNEVVSYNNLADLYHYYLKDYKKSEENWKKVVALKPDYIQGYRGLVELYKYSMTSNLGETPVVLKVGISKNPDSIDLKVMLARYYQDTGNMAEAKKVYEDAILNAERLKNAEVVATLKAELAGIR